MCLHNSLASYSIFLIGNKTLIEKEHHVHDGEHSEQETYTI